MCFALRDVDDEKRRVEKGGGAVAGALSASLAPDLPDPDMPHYFYTTKMYTGITELLINTFCCVDSNGCITAIPPCANFQ